MVLRFHKGYWEFCLTTSIVKTETYTTEQRVFISQNLKCENLKMRINCR
jgi:hypothetical protein